MNLGQVQKMIAGSIAQRSCVLMKILCPKKILSTKGQSHLTNPIKEGDREHQLSADGIER